MAQNPGLFIVKEEWPQEPEGFNGLKFGFTKEQAEEQVTFQEYSKPSHQGRNGPSLARGRTDFTFRNIQIVAFLSFSPEIGLQKIDGLFSTLQYEDLKAAFIDLFGPPHETVSWKPSLPKTVSKNHLETPILILLWYNERISVSLHDRSPGQQVGNFSLATYWYVKNFGNASKMTERARQTLKFTEETFTPPDGWSQEPDGFGELKFGMSKDEAASHVPLEQRTDIGYDAVLYKIRLTFSSVVVDGALRFTSSRLTHVSGEFDIASWELVKSVFIERYGRPHSLQIQEVWEQGVTETLDWSSDRISLRLINFPDGRNLGRFSLGPSLKGAVLTMEPSIFV